MKLLIILVWMNIACAPRKNNAVARHYNYVIMPDPDFISFLKTLKPEDWQAMVTDKWSVKDVVAHMVGWEKGDVKGIGQAWQTKTPPWWVDTEDYNNFNAQSVEFYKDFTPEQLIAEWEYWQNQVQKEIDRIGEANLRSRPDLFAWLFEGTEDDRDSGEESHYKHHYNQIRRALGML